ncbi:unnamed protein product [Mucor hiemalis]
MQQLIDSACQESRTRNAKRLSVAHYQFDFLKDIVSSIPDPLESQASDEPPKPTRASRKPKAVKEE